MRSGAINCGAGTVVRHAALRRAQRGAKLQPGGKRRMSGGLPGVAGGAFAVATAVAVAPAADDVAERLKRKKKSLQVRPGVAVFQLAALPSEERLRPGRKPDDLQREVGVRDSLEGEFDKQDEGMVAVKSPVVLWNQ